MKLQVIFYKYNFNADHMIGEKSIGIIRIILHTLANHVHECDRYRKATLGQASRSRDLSQLSIGGNSEKQEDFTSGGGPDDTPRAMSVGVHEDNDEENLEEDDSEEEEENKDEKSDPVEDQGLILEKTVEGAKPQKETNEDDDNVRVPLANLFGFLPRPSSTAKAPTPDNHQLTSDGLPPGWTMQLMRNGRTLFIDNANQVTTWIDPRTGRPAEIKEVPGEGDVRIQIVTGLFGDVLRTRIERNYYS